MKNRYYLIKNIFGTAGLIGDFNIRKVLELAIVTAGSIALGVFLANLTSLLFGFTVGITFCLGGGFLAFFGVYGLSLSQFLNKTFNKQHFNYTYDVSKFDIKKGEKK